MPLSMYDLSIPVLIRGLGVLSFYIDKAEAFTSEKNIAPAVLINARLAPDMMSFAGQVQRASDNAKGGVARLAGIEAPGFPDTETSFSELKDRIAKTVTYLQSTKPEQFDGAESKPITLKAGALEGTMRGDVYLLQILLPNFFFHIATAHGILRHNQLQIGKMDYFGRIDIDKP